MDDPSGFLEPFPIPGEPEFVAELRRHIAIFEARLAEFQQREDVEMGEIVDTAVASKAALDELKALHDGYMATVRDRMLAEDVEEVPASNGDRVELGYFKSRKAWRHAELAEIVAHRIVQSSMDPETGEVTLDREEMILELMKYATPSAWKVKALQSIGLNADNYCEAGDSTPKSTIRRAEA